MRKAALSVLPAALALSACISLGGQDLDPITVPADAFRPLERADRLFEDASGVVDYYLRLEGKSNAQVLERELGTDPDDRADRILLFSTGNYAGDSVEGEQWRIELDDTDIGYLVLRAGKRYKCYRGPNAGEWQRDLCP